MRVAASVVGAVLGCGCSALTIVSAIKEPVGTTDVDARVSSHIANVDGGECYLEKKTRTVSVVHISPTYKFGTLIDALAGAIAFIAVSSGSRSGCDPTECTGVWALGAVALDGIFALGYAIIRDRETTTSESWHLTNETAPCAR